LATRPAMLTLIRKYAFLPDVRNDCQDSSKMGFSSDRIRVFTAPRGADVGAAPRVPPAWYPPPDGGQRSCPPPTSPGTDRALQSQRRARSHDGPRIGRRTRLLETSTIQAVSRPCSSNRTCGFPASGSRTGFTPGHAQVAQDESAEAGRPPAPRRRPPRGSAPSLARGPCAVAAESGARARRHSDRPPGRP